MQVILLLLRLLLMFLVPAETKRNRSQSVLPQSVG